MDQTEPYFRTRTARIRSRKTMMTSLKTWRFDWIYHSIRRIVPNHDTIRKFTSILYINLDLRDHFDSENRSKLVKLPLYRMLWRIVLFTYLHVIIVVFTSIVSTAGTCYSINQYQKQCPETVQGTDTASNGPCCPWRLNWFMFFVTLGGTISSSCLLHVDANNYFRYSCVMRDKRRRNYFEEKGQRYVKFWTPESDSVHTIRSFVWLVDWLSRWSIDWLIDWLLEIYCLFESLIGFCSSSNQVLHGRSMQTTIQMANNQKSVVSVRSYGRKSCPQLLKPP